MTRNAHRSRVEGACRQGPLDRSARAGYRPARATLAVASHDAPLAREAVRRLQHAGTPVELETLRGLPSRAALKIARELGVAVRVYVPFGVSWVPYALDHVQNHPYVALWAIRDATIDRFVTPPLLGEMRAD